MSTITIDTTQPHQVLDITQRIEDELQLKGDGVVVLQMLHTTAGLTTADLDPGTDQDMLEAFWGMITIPEGGFRHPHNPDHAPAHLLASLIGPSVSLVVESGQLVLGTWQRIVAVEFDGPRNRSIAVQQYATSR